MNILEIRLRLAALGMTHGAKWKPELRDAYAAALAAGSPVDAIVGAVKAVGGAAPKPLSAEGAQALDAAAEAVIMYGWHGAEGQALALRQALKPQLPEAAHE
ncbi:MAG: hypothetical protein H3C28_15250 [Sphingomonadales bacterium]|nr:hypothetical protein [Sphingomonadales bacterium]